VRSDLSDIERAARDRDAALASARRAQARPMAERLELALSWNAVAAELRAGVRARYREAGRAPRHAGP
jgi:hypothetical protein